MWFGVGMSKISLHDGVWNSVILRLNAVVDLEATARQFKAFERRGKVPDAASLLRLILMCSVGHLSLRATAAAASGTIARLSDKAVEGRLRKSGDWLEHLLRSPLKAHAGSGAGGLALVDGSVIKPPGGGGPWRVPARHGPARGRFADLRPPPSRTAEATALTRLDAGQTVITDRGHARVRNIAAVLEAGSPVLTRIGWRSLALADESGRAFDLFAHLPRGLAPVDHLVRIKGVTQPLRLVIQRLPAEKLARATKRARRKSARNRSTIDPRTEQAAGHLMLLTPLPAADAVASRVIEMYRARWQGELSFKRLKTLGGIDRLPSADPRLARTWLLAHLMVAVLNDELAGQIIDPPPRANQMPPAISLWRAWQMARRLLLRAIMPVPPRRGQRRKQLTANPLAEAPRRRQSQWRQPMTA